VTGTLARQFRDTHQSFISSREQKLNIWIVILNGGEASVRDPTTIDPRDAVDGNPTAVAVAWFPSAASWLNVNVGSIEGLAPFPGW